MRSLLLDRRKLRLLRLLRTLRQSAGREWRETTGTTAVASTSLEIGRQRWEPLEIRG